MKVWVLLDRLEYRVRWKRFVPLVVAFAAIAVFVNDEGFKFAFGFVCGMLAARFAVVWKVP